MQGDGLARQRSAIIDGLRTAVLERNSGGIGLDLVIGKMGMTSAIHLC